MGQTVIKAETPDEMPFELILAKRKTIEIAVHPDKRVVVKAPEGSEVENIKKRVRKRAGWIKKQIRHFEQFDPRKPPRLYIRGESHLYMGREYRLKIERAKTDEVTLKGGYIRIKTPNMEPESVKPLLDRWYLAKATGWFEEIFEECWKRFAQKGLKKPKLKIRSMKTRWGSLSSGGNLTLNLLLIKAPGECVEYVVTHELCHLIHRNHGTEFYELQKAALPDWTERKRKLETTLA